MTSTTGDRPTPPRAPEHDPASDGSHRPQHTQSQVDRGIIFRARLGRVVTHAGIIFGVILSIFPFYWLLVMSTSTTAQIFGYPPKLTFGTSFGTNLSNLLSSIDIVSALVNTIIVSTLCAVLVMFFDSLAAFTFAKYDFPGKNPLFVVMLATFIVPGSLSLVPSFILMSRIGWVGDLKALIIPGAANAFGIFLLRQMASGSIPNELIESARIDGAGFFRTYWSVGLPMLRGGLAFLGIFTFIGAWNDYVWPLIVLVDPRKQTLQTALQNLNTLYLTDYGMVMAGALVSVLPLIVVFIIGSKQFIANIAAGAVKG
jgi:cellobiose transport system permease protein